MTKKILLVLFALVALSSAPAAAQRPGAQATVIPGQYIVVYKQSAESVRAETNAREDKLGFESELRYRHALRGFSGSLSPGQVRALRHDPEVAYVTEDRRVEASSLAPLLAGDSAPTGVRRMAAATTSTAEHSSGIGVAVLDTGVDLTHPDLNVSHGTNCVNAGGSSDDDNGHGTHVAGSIAAKNNGAGVVGVAPGTKLWAVKVLDSSGNGSYSALACGLDWVTANAASKNIKVLNMSLGGPGAPVGSCATTSDALHQAVCRAAAADVLTVAAAGNSGEKFDSGSSLEVPAAYPEVLTVTALSDSDGQSGGNGPDCAGESDDSAATFSNFAATGAGAAHTIAGPGVCITSTWPGSSYAILSGTSMASPHMAGIAALCENHAGYTGTCAGQTPTQVIATLRSQATSYSLAHSSYGFQYDPAHGPLAGVYFGYLSGAFDTAPPDTSISAAPPSATRFPDASFQFSSSEGGPRFECSVDAAAWTPCASSQQLPGLAEAPHTLSVRAIDAAGNVDPSPATHTWTIDMTAPDTSIASGPARKTRSGSARFEFSASEAGARLACKLDNKAWAECASPRKLTGLSDGSHTLSVAAVDAVGNVDPTPAKRSWTVVPGLKKITAVLTDDLAAVASGLRRFGIGKLVTRRRFIARGIDALLAGRFSIVVKGTPQGQAGVARKATLAKGSRSVSRAGGYAVKLKLTRHGRRLLRDDRRAKVTLRIEFRDQLGRATATGKSLTLRR